MMGYLKTIDRLDLLETLSVRDEWKILVPITPQERTVSLKQPMTIAEFRDKVWIPAFAAITEYKMSRFSTGAI